MGNVVTIKGAQIAPRSEQSRMETLIITQKMVDAWKHPPFQRPIRVNAKVQHVAEQMKRTEVIEGVLTLGSLKSDPGSLWVVDGQHRIQAFKISGLDEAIADVRVCQFAHMAEMADEFVRLNSSLVHMRPDDILRGLESSTPALQIIRKQCEFVGYDQIRRNGKTAPVVSMSALIRCWNGGCADTPASSMNGRSSAEMASSLEHTSLQNLLAFVHSAHAAWGRDPEYFRLWGNLNMTMCMWLWNKLVIDRDRTGNKRYAVLDVTQFKKCLMSVSADADYLSWLHGRVLGERDRSPCYMRLKSIFVRRLAQENSSRKVKLPTPAWASK